MLSSLIVTLREGLEAALVVGVLLAYLARVSRRDRWASVWLGSGLAVLASVGLGALIFATVGELEGTAEQLFEGSAMLVAVAVLSYMVHWMRRQAADVQGNLQRQVAEALRGGSGWALAVLAFVVVVREGVEAALFLFGAAQTSSPDATLAGGLLGLVAAAGLGYGLYRGGLHLDLRLFFTATGLLLIVFGAGLLAHGTHELIEAGLLPGIVEPVWDVNAVLPEASTPGLFLKTLFGYNGNPALLEVAAYVVYLGAMLTSYLRPSALGREAAGQAA